MKISRRNLKALIENYLFSEGRRDRKYIENLSIPEEDKKLYLEAESSGLKIQEISWIEKIRGSFDLFHIIQSVLEFKSDRFKQKVKVKSRRTNNPNLMKYLNLSSFKSIQELDSFIESINVDLNSHDRSRFVPLETGSDLEIVGKVGPWTIILPKTIRGSVSCDARTDKDTTWCTTKRTGQNLFYSYADDSIMLFYIMDYNRKPTKPIEAGSDRDNDSRMSLGFVDSEPFLEGQDGGLSVDASNKGITNEYLRSALGQYYDEVMRVVNESVQKHGGVNPAKEIFKKSAESLEVLLNVVKDYGEKERGSFIMSVLGQNNISQEVLSYLFNDKNETVRQRIVYNPDINPQVLEKLANDPSANVRAAVARIQHASPQTLEKLSNDEVANIRINVANNRSASPQILEKLANDANERVRSFVGENPSTSSHILEKLSNDEDTDVRTSVAGNPSANQRTLEKLSSDENEYVRLYVAGNPSANQRTLEKLSSDENADVRSYVGSNPSASPQILEKLANDEDTDVRMYVARNPSTDTQILEKLSNEEDTDVRWEAEGNINRRNLRERKRYSLKFLL